MSWNPLAKLSGSTQEQYEPKSDCYFMSSLISAQSVCFHDQKQSEGHMNICSRHEKQATFSWGGGGGIFAGKGPK